MEINNQYSSTELFGTFHHCQVYSKCVCCLFLSETST